MATPDTPTPVADVPTFQLTPPEVIVPVPAESAPAVVPLAAETKSAVDAQVARFIDALKTYLSIPAQYANSRPIHDGKTAVDIFRGTIVELEAKVAQLADDLAS